MTEKTLGESQSKVDLSKGKVLKFNKYKDKTNSDAMSENYLECVESVIKHGGYQRIDLTFEDSVGIKKEILITIIER